MAQQTSFSVCEFISTATTKKIGDMKTLSGNSIPSLFECYYLSVCLISPGLFECEAFVRGFLSQEGRLSVKGRDLEMIFGD